MDFEVRRLDLDDLSDAEELRALAGWNQTMADWESILQLHPGGCFAAVADGELVGTTTTTPYGDLAWVGMVLVAPRARRQGVARQLCRRALEHLEARGVVSAGLDATPLGEPLYASLGFRRTEGVTRWLRSATASTEAVECGFRAGESTAAAPARATRAASSSLDVIRAIDVAATGIDRGAVLAQLHRRSRCVVASGRARLRAVPTRCRRRADRSGHRAVARTGGRAGERAPQHDRRRSAVGHPRRQREGHPDRRGLRVPTLSGIRPDVPRFGTLDFSAGVRHL